MTRWKLILEWDGTPFMGWQRQDHGPSVQAALEEQERGNVRLQAFLDATARRIRSGRIGPALGSPKGLLAGNTPPLTARLVDGALRFELAPHFGIHDDEDDEQGGHTWQLSS